MEPARVRQGGRGGGSGGGGRAPGLRPGSDAARARRGEGDRDRLRQRQQVQERRPAHGRRGGLRAHHARRRRARRRDRGCQHRGAGPRGRQRGLRRAAQRRGGGPARLVLHARAEEAGGRRRRPGGRTHAVARREGGGADRPPPAGGQGGPGLRASFKIEDDLNTENSRRKWLEWKRRIDPKHYLDPATRSEAAERARREMVAEGLLDPDRVYGTINCDGINARGEMCGVTTTSGLSWKIPGRVGDSPILGAGLYVDGDVGAAGSTGRGEANLFNLSSFLIVENLRRGMHPKDAGMDALKRVAANTVEKRLLNDKAHPMFDLKFYVLDRQGRHAGVSLHGGKAKNYAVCTEDGPRTLPCDALFDEPDTE
ncbi:MAG: hypothetical protein DMF81_00370 [Acidobacteria bacterium]|nr:MAG: hypothetical protein DMF81_00370 [Acidobacteriota bacterium]